MSTHNKHGYESFLYRIRGYIKNLNIEDGTFNIEPISLHDHYMNVSDRVKPAVALIGTRLVRVGSEMKNEGDVFPVLRTTRFKCSSMPQGVTEGDYRELHIGEVEAQRIKPLIASSNLVVNVAGML